MEKMYNENEVLDLMNQAHEQKSRLYYFLYKVLKERGLDYEGIITDIVKYNITDLCKNIHEVMDKVENAADYTKLFTSDHELNAKNYGQEISKKEENESIVLLKDCPMVRTWKKMNIDPAERKELCDLIKSGDYIVASNFDSIDFNIEKTCADSDCCKLVIRKKQ